MAYWKKLATYNSANDKVEGSITGVAYGGLSSSLSVSDGGTGTDTSQWARGSMPMYSGGDGATWTAISPPTSANQMLVSNSTGTWGWEPVSTSHVHEGYLNIASEEEQILASSINIKGALACSEIQVAEFTQITSTTATQVVLNSSGGSANGDNCGIYCDRSGDTTIATDDPAILWNHSESRWKAGKYNSQMYEIGLYDSNQSLDTGAAYSVGPGVIHSNSNGDVFISV